MIFEKYIGIDYSGAQTPEASLPGLRVYESHAASLPVEVPPPPSPRKYWARKEVAQWLLDQVNKPQRVVVGIDHGFSFPLRYFERYGLPLDWEVFLRDFREHWPTHEDHTYVSSVRDGNSGKGAARSGDSRWRRLTDIRVRAKSVFHFGVPGSVASSTHAGLPWLLHIREKARKPVHFWPFDGWAIPAGASVIAEAYPALCSGNYARDGRTSDQHDAYSLAAWLREVDQAESLVEYFAPNLSPEEREIADIEGWILGAR